MAGRIGIGTGAATLALLIGASGAQAHSPYLLPNTFDASGRDHVTLEGSFTEHFFIPEISMKSDGFFAVGPDGRQIALTPTYMKDVTLLELPTTVNGTWRVSSGTRIGRVAKAALIKGEWVFQNEKKPLPEGAVAVDMQSITCSEVYVSRGAPNDAALKPRGEGLEFQPLTHPDKIGAGEPARFVLLLDGKPLAGQRISMTRGDDLYSEDKPFPDVTTDAKGAFTLMPKKPGVYHAMTRYRQAPVTAGGPAKSLTYALVFEAVK